VCSPYIKAFPLHVSDECERIRQSRLHNRLKADLLDDGVGRYFGMSSSDEPGSSSAIVRTIDQPEVANRRSELAIRFCVSSGQFRAVPESSETVEKLGYGVGFLVGDTHQVCYSDV
jgi:hypothetical protein